MTATLLRRGGAEPPVRAVHLGLGSFFRAHQAWYTDRATDGEAWGYAAFTGRRPDLAEALREQDGLYTLITRAADGDEFTVVRSVAQAHAADDSDDWLAALACADVRLLTVTVTEAGYLSRPDGGLDLDRPRVQDDIAALRADPRAAVASAPARIVAGLLARRACDAGPLALVPCDNLPGNGRVLGAVLRDLAAAVDPGLLEWMHQQTSVVTTMVDRITPEPTGADRRAVLASTGVADRSPVVTEPFSEWALSGDFPGGRPAWEQAGAVFTRDIEVFENRKLWMLNGAHSLLAYAGPLRGHDTVAEAAADPVCRAWLEDWWDACQAGLALSADDVAAYRTALLERFDNPRIRHTLAQIAADGSQKLPVRILPVLRHERARRKLPDAAVTTLAAWVLHLRGAGAPVKDVRSGEFQLLAAGPLQNAIPRTLGALDPASADDAELVAAVQSRVADLS